MANPWTATEDDIIRLQAGSKTAREIHHLLPSRTFVSVKQRIVKLGVKRGLDTRWGATSIGKRTLVAKTCRRCGRLCPAGSFGQNGAYRDAACRDCRAPYFSEKNKGREQGGTKEQWLKDAQSLTLSDAPNHGKAYTERDHAILADPDKSTLEKALELGRSYFATNQAVHQFGYRSGKFLSERDLEQWLIVHRGDRKTSSGPR